MTLLILTQVALLIFHQVTTIFDFHPFNGVRYYSNKEKLVEAGSNGLLMSVAPIGFGLHIKALMSFGVVYYFVLFAIELLIWWVPYFTVPSGQWRTIYNRILSCATSNFEKGDTLDNWVAIYNRIHRGTITIWPLRENRPVPNLEHTILHVWTLVTAVLTARRYFSSVQ